MIIEKLSEHGIVIPRGSSPYMTDCPKPYCRASRDKNDNRCLRVEVEGDHYAEWVCSKCLWKGKEGQKQVAVDDTPIAPPEPSTGTLPDAPLEYLRSLGITDQVIHDSQIGWDSERNSIKILYRSEMLVMNAALVNISNGSSRLASWKNVVFYGLQDLQLRSDSSEIIITNREVDCLILRSLSFQNVIAVPNGGALPEPSPDQDNDRLAFISSAADYFQKCTRVVIALDDTPDGNFLRNEIARRIGQGKCWVAKLSKMTMQEVYKYMGGDDVCADINEAKPLPICGLYEVQDFERELMDYYHDGMASGVGTGWLNVDKLYTVVPGQLTVVTGIPNSGKSEWVDALTLNIALKQGWRFVVFSPENGKIIHTTKLIEKYEEMSADPRSTERMPTEAFYRGSMWVRQHYSFIESTNMLPTLDWILERAADAVLRRGVKGLVIDPWNRISKKMEGYRSETDYVAEALTKILQFIKSYDVHCWLIVHPRQQEKDKKTGKIPPPSLYDMAGSAHFVNMCDNGLVIHRSDSIDDTTEIYVNKIRFKHVGSRGQTKLSYNKSTGRYRPLDEVATYSMADMGDTDGIKQWEAV